MRRPPLLLLCAVALSVAGGTALRAHEIGTTRVALTFERDRSYRVDVVTDAVALVEKLENVNGDEPQAVAPELLASRLRSLDALFRRRLSLAFDGKPATPGIEYVVEMSEDANTPPSAKIRLSGDLPPAAERFTWTYSWTFSPYSFTVEREGAGRPATRWLDGGESSGELAVAAPEPSPERLRTALQYVWLGVTHIVPKGVDHMLFVLGVFLLNRRLRPVLWQVTAFTAAHSITLALSLYGVVLVSPAVVEPLIALSIVYVAVENLFVTELTVRRVALVFGFGLLHGLGFAGVLRELGLPSSEVAMALLSFNVGVEIGQLSVIGAACLLVGSRYSARAWYRQRIVVPASVAIASVSLYWTIARLPL